MISVSTGEHGIEVAEATIWHDVECSAYDADLAEWRDLAAAGGGHGVLELGCGSGRVSLDLAAAGHDVHGLDREPELIEALRGRAEDSGLALGASVGDVAEFDLGRRFGLIIAPMQLIQLLDAEERAAALAGTARHLAPGGVAAFAIMAAVPLPWRAGPNSPAPPPDVREHEGWIYSSLPIGIEVERGHVAVRRLRQRVFPAGSLAEHEDIVHIHDLSADQLEAEGSLAGLAALERRQVPETEDHLGSSIVVLGGTG